MNEATRELVPGFVKKWMRFVVISFRFPLAKLRAFPNFIIIGVQKGGTTTLFDLLRQHPSIKTSIFKEVHFYDFAYNKGINWYKSFFPLREKGKNLIYGEASPYYVFHPLVPERVFKDNPDVKLILLLRDPIARAYSHYQMEKRKGREKNETFEKAIKAETELMEKASHSILNNNSKYNFNHHIVSYLSRGRYFEQIERWLQYFGREQLLVIKSELFFANPTFYLESIYKFLDVEVIVPKEVKAKNKGDYLPINEETLSELRTYYKPYNQQLSLLLGEEFSWE